MRIILFSREENDKINILNYLTGAKWNNKKKIS